MTDLPKGWVQTTLGCIADWGSGGTPKATEAAYYGGAIPWAVIGDLNDSVVTATATMITDSGLKNSSAKVIEPGTLLVAMYGSIGKLGIAGQRMATNQAIAFARGHPGVADNRFLFWFLQWRRPDLGAAGKGATQKNISQTVLKAWPIPLPPLAEQERIVAAIEEQFSRLDAADSALDSAVRRLTPLPTRLIDHSLAGLPTKPLGGLIREPLRNGHSAKRAPEGSIPIFTLTAVTERDFSERNTKLTDADPQRVEDLWVQPGDIFVERANTPELVGTAAVYAGPPRLAIFPDLLIRVRVGQLLVPAFAELALRSTRLRQYFQQRAKGIAGSMPKIDQATILEAEVPVPPIEVQERLVAEVDRHLTMTQRLSAAISRALTRSEHLRRAILDRAFTGRLVPQEANDEPALDLLARIAAQRADATKTRRERRA